MEKNKKQNSKTISAEESDKLFDEGASVMPYVDLSSTTQPNKKPQKSIATQQAVLIKSKLLLTTHNVSREFIVPLDYTFKKLHDVMQVLYDWDDYHMYSFRAMKGDKILCAVGMDHEDYDDFDLLGRDKYDRFKSHRVKLKDVLTEYKKWIYLYDFGDGWEHELSIGKIIDDFDKGHPFCLKAEGIAPPEDCGGAYGFEELLELAENPPKKNSDEYEYAKEIMESLSTELDLNALNETLSKFMKRGRGKTKI